jgi:mannosyltransferase
VIIISESFRDKTKQDEKIFLLVFLLVPPLTAFVISYLVRPVFVARVFLTVSMFFFALGGWVLSKHLKDFVGWFVVGGFVIGALIGLPYQLTFDSFPRSPFQQAAEFLSEHYQNGKTVIVNDNKLSYFPIHYYAPNLVQSFIGDAAGSLNDTFAPGTQKAMNIYPVNELEQAIGGGEEIYFIVFQETLDEYRLGGSKNHPRIDRLRKLYQSEKVISFNDLLIYFYSQPVN